MGEGRTLLPGATEVAPTAVTNGQDAGSCPTKLSDGVACLEGAVGEQTLVRLRVCDAAVARGCDEGDPRQAQLRVR